MIIGVTSEPLVSESLHSELRSRRLRLRLSGRYGDVTYLKSSRGLSGFGSPKVRATGPPSVETYKEESQSLGRDY